eukprot:6594152-Pyramimonas_sp.AAC.1
MLGLPEPVPLLLPDSQGLSNPRAPSGLEEQRLLPHGWEPSASAEAAARWGSPAAAELPPGWGPSAAAVPLPPSAAAEPPPGWE